ncbi:hypothetical protein ABPG72_013815 [Tetrahymena utriculariae]
MQTRINYRDESNNANGFGVCVQSQNSQKDLINPNMPFSQKSYTSVNQINYDLHRRVFGQELSNYNTVPVSSNSQSQKTIGMSQGSQQNQGKKMSTQTEEGGMKYYEKIYRGMQMQQQPQQFQKQSYFPQKAPSQFFNNNGGAQIAQIEQMQDYQNKDARKRSERTEISDMANFNPKFNVLDAAIYKGDFGLDLNIQAHTTSNAISSKNQQRLIQDQDNSNFSTTNSSNDNFEIQTLNIENAKTRGQKEIERQYTKIFNEDKQNPCKVAQYSREIFQFLKQKEKQILINKNYMEEQNDISEHMRWILIDWLIEVHYKFKLLQETLFIAVYIIDKYLSITKIKRSKLQTIGITALFIAAKYEEIYPPELREFSDITDRACSKSEILQMEGDIINALNFQITVPSSYRFAEWYTRLAELLPQDQCLVFYFIEVALLDTRFLKYSPSNIAASAVYMVNKLNRSESCWSDLLEKDSGYNEQKLRPCAKDLIFIQQKLQKIQQKAVATKYSRPQFYKVGSIVLFTKQDSNPNQTKSQTSIDSDLPHKLQGKNQHMLLVQNDNSSKIYQSIFNDKD